MNIHELYVQSPQRADRPSMYRFPTNGAMLDGNKIFALRSKEAMRFNGESYVVYEAYMDEYNEDDMMTILPGTEIDFANQDIRLIVEEYLKSCSLGIHVTIDKLDTDWIISARVTLRNPEGVPLISAISEQFRDSFTD